MSEQATVLTLPVRGMTCASCVSHVESALKEVPGVASVTVSLATERATIQFANGGVPIEQLRAAVQDVGYDVPVESTTLTVSGMTCASCVSHVEGALAELPGVTEAVVNLGLGTARVSYVPGVVTLGQMKRAVREVGYVASEASPGADALDRERQAREEEIKRQWRNLLIAGGIGLLVMIGTFYDRLGPFKAIVPEFLSYKWVLGLLTTPIVLGPGRQFFTNSWRGLKHGVTAGRSTRSVVG